MGGSFTPVYHPNLSLANKTEDYIITHTAYTPLYGALFLNLCSFPSTQVKIKFTPAPIIPISICFGNNRYQSIARVFIQVSAGFNKHNNSKTMPLCESVLEARSYYFQFQAKTRVPKQQQQLPPQQQQNMVQRQSNCSIGSNSTTPLLLHSSSGEWGEDEVLRGKMITRRRGAIKHQRYTVIQVIYTIVTAYLKMIQSNLLGKISRCHVKNLVRNCAWSNIEQRNGFHHKLPCRGREYFLLGNHSKLRP